MRHTQSFYKWLGSGKWLTGFGEWLTKIKKMTKHSSKMIEFIVAKWMTKS
jgi:hypothetical protein